MTQRIAVSSPALRRRFVLWLPARVQSSAEPRSAPLRSQRCRCQSEHPLARPQAKRGGRCRLGSRPSIWLIESSMSRVSPGTRRHRVMPKSSRSLVTDTPSAVSAVSRTLTWSLSGSRPRSVKADGSLRSRPPLSSLTTTWTPDHGVTRAMIRSTVARASGAPCVGTATSVPVACGLHSRLDR
jgi:hypothetical protein